MHTESSGVRETTSRRKENRCRERLSRWCRRVVGAGRICEAVEKFTRSDGDVWRLCVRDLLSSEVEARSHSIPVLLSPLASSRSHPGFLVDVLITAVLSVC